MLPQRIVELLDNFDMEDCKFSILKIDFEQDVPTIKIKLTATSFDESENVIQFWTVTANRCKACSVNLDDFYTIELKNEDPLIWIHNNGHRSLYFNGRSTDTGKLCFDLYQAHVSQFGELVSFETFINTQRNLYDLLASGYGLLANGPQKLMTIYASCLQKHNVQYSTPGERLPTYWNGKEHLAETELQLLLLGDSYIVAEDFEFYENKLG
jgi:hypothetical protein